MRKNGTLVQGNGANHSSMSHNKKQFFRLCMGKNTELFYIVDIVHDKIIESFMFTYRNMHVAVFTPTQVFEERYSW